MQSIRFRDWAMSPPKKPEWTTATCPLCTLLSELNDYPPPPLWDGCKMITRQRRSIRIDCFGHGGVQQTTEIFSHNCGHLELEICILSSKGTRQGTFR